MAIFMALHAVAYVFYTLIRIPFWMLYFIPSSLRQHPQWTYRQALRVRLFRAFIYVLGRARFSPPLSLEPGNEGNRFVVMQPASTDMYKGILRCDPSIKEEKIGGTWYPSIYTEGDKGDIVLHFHGGGYTLGNGRPQDCAFAASLILMHTPATHIFCPQYRLASHYNNRFPAQLQDALTSYLYFVRTLVTPAEKVILSGDSAGGHMVIQLLRYISERGSGLNIPAPKAAWLWSPWCDAASPLLNPDILYTSPQRHTDFLPNTDLITWMRDAYTPSPSSNIPLTNEYFSPLGHPFRLPCRVWAMVGGAENNFREVTSWVEEMQRWKGNDGKVEVWVEEKSTHDVFKCGGLLGFEMEARMGVERVAVCTWGVCD